MIVVTFLHHLSDIVGYSFMFPQTGESMCGRQDCQYGFCITLIEGEITAEAGLCVVLIFYFTLNSPSQILDRINSELMVSGMGMGSRMDLHTLQEQLSLLKV